MRERERRDTGKSKRDRIEIERLGIDIQARCRKPRGLVYLLKLQINITYTCRYLPEPFVTSAFFSFFGILCDRFSRFSSLTACLRTCECQVSRIKFGACL